MTQKFSNRAIAILQTTITNVATSLTVEASKADRFPVADTGTDPVNTVGKDWFKIALIDTSGNYEVCYARTRTLGSATISNIIRAQEGTTGIAFTAGSIVVQDMTAADIENAINKAAADVAFSPAGSVSATNTQAAIAELDSEKLSSADGSVTTSKIANGAVTSAKVASNTFLSATADSTVGCLVFGATQTTAPGYLGTSSAVRVAQIRVIGNEMTLFTDSSNLPGTWKFLGGGGSSKWTSTQSGVGETWYFGLWQRVS